MKIFLFLVALLCTLNANELDDIKLKKMIGRMLVVGFENENINSDSQIVKDIRKYNLGGVILFDKFYDDRNRTKNISSMKQVQKLTKQLTEFSNKSFLIGLDQEGGKVGRLKHKYGFEKTPSAFKVSKMSPQDAKIIYKKQSDTLKRAGINTNFAPVVDLAINPKNKVIVGLERSFGENSIKVALYAKIMMNEQRKKNIFSVLKHFPGHGSSLGDSHQGFVDISETWSEKELQPYKILIDEGNVDMIMTAHVFNKHLDEKYPATLSYKINTELLREHMNYRGIIISDDLQMKAISKLYSIKEATSLAINAGVDMLLFGNQLANVSVSQLVSVIFEEVKSGNIPIERIIESNNRIENTHTKNSLIQKPIIFSNRRKELTKKYVKDHYGKKINNILMRPKMIVLHWTAVMDLQKSFQRLNPELLFSDRTDIANASALNVSSHFLIDRDGTIYQLMPDNWIARHVIGLNYFSIGIENVGGEANAKEDLTNEQLQANVKLIKYLRAKYSSITKLIGHYEYREFENTPLWLEKDAGYRTNKVDPGENFMHKVRTSLHE